MLFRFTNLGPTHEATFRFGEVIATLEEVPPNYINITPYPNKQLKH